MISRRVVQSVEGPTELAVYVRGFAEGVECGVGGWCQGVGRVLKRPPVILRRGVQLWIDPS